MINVVQPTSARRASELATRMIVHQYFVELFFFFFLKIEKNKFDEKKNGPRIPLCLYESLADKDWNTITTTCIHHGSSDAIDRAYDKIYLKR